MENKELEEELNILIICIIKKGECTGHPPFQNHLSNLSSCIVTTTTFRIQNMILRSIMIDITAPVLVQFWHNASLGHSLLKSSFFKSHYFYCL